MVHSATAGSMVLGVMVTILPSSVAAANVDAVIADAHARHEAKPGQGGEHRARIGLAAGDHRPGAGETRDDQGFVLAVLDVAMARHGKARRLQPGKVELMRRPARRRPGATWRRSASMAASRRDGFDHLGRVACRAWRHGGGESSCFEIVERLAAAHQAHEPGVVDLVGFVDPGQPAAREDDEAVADRQGVLDIVGDQDHRRGRGRGH